MGYLMFKADDCGQCARNLFEKLAGAAMISLAPGADVELSLANPLDPSDFTRIKWSTISGSCRFSLSYYPEEECCTLLLQGSLIGGLASLENTLGRLSAHDWDEVDLESSIASAIEDYLAGRCGLRALDEARDRIHNLND